MFLNQTKFCQFQKSEEFKKAVREAGGIVWHGVPGATNQWQPIDSGPGKS